MTINLATNPTFQGLHLTFGDISDPGETEISRVDSSHQAMSITPSLTEDNLQVLRCTFDSTPTAASSLGLTEATLTEGTTYTILVELRASRDLEVDLQVRGNRAAGASVTTCWGTYRGTVRAGTGAVHLTSGVLFPVGSVTAGDWLEARTICVVEDNYQGPHFDGSTTPARWAGEPHQSVSILNDTIEPALNALSMPAAGAVPPDFALVRNVRKYGAVGDGTTDDTAAIAAALAAGDDYATIYFPPGRYRITSQLTWDPYRANLLGRGAAIYCDIDNPNTYAIRVISSSPFPGGAPAHASRSHHAGIEFYTTGHRCNGLLFEGVEGKGGISATFEHGRRKNAHFTLEHMVFRGFNIAHSINSYTYMMGFRDCVFTLNKTAAQLAPGGHDYGERIYYDGCDFTNNDRTSWMIDMRGDQEFKFINCSFDWSPMMLRAANSSKIDIVGCHIETPADGPMLTASEIKGIDRCFMSVQGTAVVNISHSLLYLNYFESDNDLNPIPYVFFVEPWASVNISSSHMTMPAVAALSSGGGRVTVAQAKVWTNDTRVPMLAHNAKHNRLSSGEFQEATVYDKWSHLGGGTGSAGVVTSPAINSAAIRMVHGTASSSELRVTVPAAAPLRIVGFTVKLRADAAKPALRIDGARIDFLDRTGTVVGHVNDEWNVPFTLSTSEWRTFQYVRYIDHESWWNTDVVTNIRISFVRNSGTSGQTYYVGAAYVNYYG